MAIALPFPYSKQIRMSQLRGTKLTGRETEAPREEFAQWHH